MVTKKKCEEAETFSWWGGVLSTITVSAVAAVCYDIGSTLAEVELRLGWLERLRRRQGVIVTFSEQQLVELKRGLDARADDGAEDGEDEDGEDEDGEDEDGEDEDGEDEDGEYEDGEDEDGEDEDGEDDD